MVGVAREPDERDMNKRRRGTSETRVGGVEPRGRRSVSYGVVALLRLVGQRAIPLVGVAVAVALTSSTAFAQVWLQDRAASEGAGVQLGDFEFHPGIGAQGGYDSNWFLRTDKTGNNITNGNVQGTPVMLITPSVSLATMGAQRKEGAGEPENPTVTFRTTASGTYREFFGQLTPEQRNGSIDAAANLTILPGRPWGGAISASYDRVIQPSAFGDPDLAFTRDVISGSAEIAMQPGSGTLDWHFGGSASGTLFEETGGQGYNNFSFGAFTRGRWKFRPKTALLYDATFGFSNYANTDAGAGTITTLHSSDPIRTRLGINGLITPRLSLLAMAGYGGSFFSPGSSAQVQQYDSVIAQAELKIFLTAPAEAGPGAASLSQSTLSFGYTRDFSTSYLSDYYGLDRGYLKFAYYFAGRAMISLEGGGAAIEYPTLFLPTTTHSGFTDARIDGTLFSEYRFTNSFGLNATLRYTTNLSNAVINITPAGAGPMENYAMQWQRFEAYLGVRLFL
jgi:hypothetical protein